MTRNDVVLNGALAWCSWPNSESNGLRAASCWAFTGCCCSFAGRAAGLDLRDSGAEDGTRRGVNCCVRASTLPPFVVHVAPSLNMEVPLQVPVLASVGLLAKSWAVSANSSTTEVQLLWRCRSGFKPSLFLAKPVRRRTGTT